VFDFNDINEAVDRVVKNEVKFVLALLVVAAAIVSMFTPSGSLQGCVGMGPQEELNWMFMFGLEEYQ
jgi:hypothetical protein